MEEKVLLSDDTQVNADEIMAEFDRESNVRHFTGTKKKVIRAIMIAFALYAIVLSIFGKFLLKLDIQLVTSLMNAPGNIAGFIAFILVITFLLFPAYKKQAKKINYIPWYDYILSLAGFASFFYIVVENEGIVHRAMNINTLDKIVAIIGFVVLVEACRRVVGLPILCVVGAFVAYAFMCGVKPFRLLYELFYAGNGIMSTPLSICASYLALFIIFGSFLEKTGIGGFFVNIANSVAGWAAGGPAKVAVISSALEGMYSGSSVANTVGSGSITIPIMKKIGYKPEFAAAVEAAASTGGQIMPPIMGAAAFLMAEYTSIPYMAIAVAAILPALLYFMGIFLMIHFEAKKMGMKGLSREDLPKFGKLMLTRGYLLVPIIILVAMMSNGFSPALSVAIAILASIIVSSFSSETRLSISAIGDALQSGTKGTISVSVACAIAGNMVGLVTLTHLSQDLIRILNVISDYSVFLALVLIMLTCILLGMGVPTTANYVIMATMAAPLITQIIPSTPILAAHMFVFYFGILADITPPVALAAYAGSAIAKSNPLKTGFVATRLAITAFIIPYIFVLQPDMLLLDLIYEGGYAAENLNITFEAIYSILRIVFTSIIGMIGISMGMEGYGFKRMTAVERVLALGGGLCLIFPEQITDIVGIVLVAGIILYGKFSDKIFKSKAKA